MWTIICILIGLIYFIIHLYKEKKKEIKPEIGQLWVKNETDPFRERKVAEITDIRKNNVGDVYVKVRYRFGDNLRDGGYGDSWEFEFFRLGYSLLKKENNLKD